MNFLILLFTELVKSQSTTCDLILPELTPPPAELTNNLQNQIDDCIAANPGFHISVYFPAEKIKIASLLLRSNL